MYSKIRLRFKSVSRAHRDSRCSLAIVGGLFMLLLVFGIGQRASAGASTVLMHRVERALRANDNLNDAMCYTTAPGVVVLYRRVFDEKDRRLAEATSNNVRGVNQVVNTLRTTTGKWLEEEERINDTLQSNDLPGISARVVGPDVYISGTVTIKAEKQRAGRVVASVSRLRVSNMVWVQPGSLF